MIGRGVAAIVHGVKNCVAFGTGFCGLLTNGGAILFFRG